MYGLLEAWAIQGVHCPKKSTTAFYICNYFSEKSALGGILCGKNYKGQSKVFLVSADSLIVSCLKWTVICISVAIGYYISRRDIGNELLQKCKKVVREKTAYYRQARKSLWQRVL